MPHKCKSDLARSSSRARAAKFTITQESEEYSQTQLALDIETLNATRSVLKLSLNLAHEEMSVFNISKNDERGRILQKCMLVNL